MASALKLVSPHRMFPPWIVALVAAPVIGALIKAENGELRSSGALALAGLAVGIPALCAVAALIAPRARIFVLRQVPEALDRENLITAAAIYGAVAVFLLVTAVAR